MKLRRIAVELKEHAPFTAIGTVSGIIVMVAIMAADVPFKISYNVFYVLHPLHALLSALVTTAMYKEYGSRKIWKVVLVGYFGAVIIATISDSLIPYVGEFLLGLPNRGLHIGFIEEWWLVNSLVLVGVAIGYLRPATKFPHFGHVLLSTWASLFHITMALGDMVSTVMLVIIFVFLFLAVWIPCCLSDIVFPLLFARASLPHHHR